MRPIVYRCLLILFICGVANQQAIAQRHANCWLEKVSGYNVSFTGDEPTKAQLHAEMFRLSIKYGVPVEIIGAVGVLESGGMYQYAPDGFLYHNHDECEDAFAGFGFTPPGLGMMMLTGATAEGTGDIRRLITDWRFNLEQGVKVLANKYEQVLLSPNATPHPDWMRTLKRVHRGILENWFYAIRFYQGYEKGRFDYVDIVMRNLKNPSQWTRINDLFQPLFIARPSELFANWSDGDAYVALPDGTWMSNTESINHAVNRGQTPVCIVLRSKESGAGVSGATVNVGTYQTISTSGGRSFIPAALCGIRSIAVHRFGFKAIDRIFSIPCGLAQDQRKGIQSVLALAAESEPALVYSEMELETDGTCGGGSTRFAVGDVVEVFGTGIGLRARFSSPCSDSWIVKADGARGTIIGNAVCCNGFNRWPIRFNDMPGTEAWCAEGEPSSQELFLRPASAIQSISLDPPSGVGKIVGSALSVEVWVNLAAAQPGYLQAKIIAADGVSVKSGVKVDFPVKGNRVVDLNLTSPNVGTVYYRTFVQFRPGGTGPFDDDLPGDVAGFLDNYAIRWVRSFDEPAINSVTFSPPAGAGKIVNSTLPLEVWVNLKPTTTGYLQARLTPVNGGSSIRSGVRIMSSVEGNRVVDIPLTSGIVGTIAYDTFVQFRPGANGPFDDQQPSDVTAKNSDFSVRWVTDFNTAVTVSANPTFGGNVQGTGRFEEGTRQQISAQPNAGYTFIGWSDGNLEPIRTIAVPASNTTYVANFAPVNFKLDISWTPIGGGTVRKSPDQEFFAAGTQVSLTPIANEGYSFNGWTDDSNAHEGTRIITLDANKSFSANFRKISDVKVQMAEPGKSHDTFHFNLNGKPGELYAVQVSDDLITWQPHSTHMIPASAVVNVKGNMTSRRQFYRAQQVSMDGTLNGKRLGQIVPTSGKLDNRQELAKSIANTMLTNGPLTQLSSFTPNNVITSGSAIFWAIKIVSATNESLSLNDVRVVIKSSDSSEGVSTNILGSIHTFPPSATYSEAAIGIRSDGSRIPPGTSSITAGSPIVFTDFNPTFNASEQEASSFLRIYPNLTLTCEVWVKGEFLTSYLLTLENPF